MSSLSTKANKSRSTPSRLQAKAASKTSIKKASPAKESAKTAKPSPAKTGKSSTLAAKTSPAKKADGKRAPEKGVSKKAPAKASAKKAAAPKLETRTVEFQPQKNFVQQSRAAVEAFEKALKLFGRHDFAAAKEAFKQILEKFGNQTDIIAGARTYLAIVEQRLARTPALPKSPDALYDRGVFEFNKANFQEAINLFEKALKAQPEAAHVFYSLAAAYARMNNTKKAIEALRRATDIQSALRSRARSDQDFASLHNNDDFRYMTGYGFDFQD